MSWSCPQSAYSVSSYYPTYATGTIITTSYPTYHYPFFGIPCNTTSHSAGFGAMTPNKMEEYRNTSLLPNISSSSNVSYTTCYGGFAPMRLNYSDTNSGFNGSRY